MTAKPLVEVVDLGLSYRREDDWRPALHGVSFAIAPGEAFGLVGESGCGKSTLAYQILGFRAANARIDSGRIVFQGRDMARLPRTELDCLRGDRMALVPQNPTTALSPGMRVGRQIVEVLETHGRAANRAEARRRVVELFHLVGLPAPERIAARYPHELSGGQQQRVVIAMAIACDPDLVVLDEPTTGLDVTTQEQVLELLCALRDRIGMSMLYVTHDLAVLAEIADRVGVMYAGHMVELGPSEAIFSAPRHPYTRGLIASIPRLDDDWSRPRRPLRGLLRPDELPEGCPFEPRCDFAMGPCAVNVQRLEPAGPGHAVACERWCSVEEAATEVPTADASPTADRERRVGPNALLTLEGLDLAYGRESPVSRLLGARPLTVVNDLSLTLDRGRTLALVGESGSGKSTIARAVSGILPPGGGRILFDGEALPGSVRRRSRQLRRRIQYIFQNPDASLNPRARIGATLARPIDLFFNASSTEIRERVAAALDDVRLDAGYARRYPDELSGGERQRVAIARALVCEPDLLLCDEILSALDVSVQANILAMLKRLRVEHGISMLFISHDLAVVKELADEIAVLYRGELMEWGPTEAIFTPPYHPYTHSLLMAVPGLDLDGKTPPPLRQSPAPPVGVGCAFAGRCPWKVGEICDRERPPWRATAAGSRLRCHIPLEEIAERALWRPRLDLSRRVQPTLG